MSTDEHTAAPSAAAPRRNDGADLGAWCGVWVNVELERGRVNPVSWELLGEGRKGDIIVTPEKAEELSRPQQAGQPAAGKGKTRGKAAAFDPQAMKKLLEEQKRAADAESARERDMGARAPTAGQESSGIDFRRD